MKAITLGGSLLKMGTSPRGQKEFSDLVPWFSSFDAADSTLYTPSSAEQTAWTIDGTTRVDTCANQGAYGVPLRRDTGSFDTGVSNKGVGVPGPLWVASANHFNGRPAWRFDGPLGGTSITHSGLFPLMPRGTPSNSATWMNPPTGVVQAYSLALLVRPDGGKGALDADFGADGTGPTVCAGNGGTFGGAGSTGKWFTGNFGFNIEATLPLVLQHLVSANETTLIFQCSAGGFSFFEATWRNSNGSYGTERVIGAMNTFPYKEFFLGWLHGGDSQRYITAFGIMSGAITEAQMDAVRTWAKPYIPPAGALASQP